MSLGDGVVRIVSVQQPAELRSHVAAWELLASNASEDNPFYEHWMLIPALECLGEDKGVEVLFVYRGEELVGVIPIQLQSRYRGAPLSHLQLWQYRHCYLCTPLVTKGAESTFWVAFFGWLRERRLPALTVWNWASADGPLHGALEQLARRNGWVVRRTSYERAVLEGEINGEEYVKTVLSGKHRRDVGRLEKRLSEEGTYAYSRVDSESEVDRWLEFFFGLEAGGWKGREGTAMRTNPGDRDFMNRVVQWALRSKRVILSMSQLDGKPIACRCDFVARQSSFGFKIAFNEEYSKYRPGLLLELWRLRMLSPSLHTYFDSCSQPGSMFDRLWSGRRKIANVSIATRAFPEGFVVRSIPVVKDWVVRLKSIRRALEHHSQPEKSADAAD